MSLANHSVGPFFGRVGRKWEFPDPDDYPTDPDRANFYGFAQQAGG